MNLESLKKEFKGRVCEQIGLEEEGLDRFLVLTPFRFDDGDHFAIMLKREGEGWILTDEATTLMHLSYWLDVKDLEFGNRKDIVDSSLAAFGVKNRGGELVIPVIEEKFGDALFNFVQALSKITDVSFLSREVVKSTFIQDFRDFMRTHVSEDRLEFDWNDKIHDPTGNYPVDCRVNSMKKPLLVYALPGEEKVGVATIALLTFERWGIPFQSLGIFEDQESIARKPLARFSDVVEKSYSNLESNRERIAAFLADKLREKST